MEELKKNDPQAYEEMLAELMRQQENMQAEEEGEDEDDSEGMIDFDEMDEYEEAEYIEFLRQQQEAAEEMEESSDMNEHVSEEVEKMQESEPSSKREASVPSDKKEILKTELSKSEISKDVSSPESPPKELRKLDLEEDKKSPEEKELAQAMLEEKKEEEIDFSQNPEFANLPPLDPMRKARRTILRAINNTRRFYEINPLDIDIIANQVATEYAGYLLNNPENEEYIKTKLSKSLLVSDYKCIVGCRILERDVMSTDAHSFAKNYLDAHGLVEEIEDKRTVLLNKDFNIVGLGFASDEDKIRVVELYANSNTIVNSINKIKEPPCVEVKGKMKNEQNGVYAARISTEDNMKKDIILIPPTNMSYNKSNLEFTISIPLNPDSVLYTEPRHVIEFYIRNKPGTIPYGQQITEKINLQHLTLSQRTYLDWFPDPRVIVEDQIDLQREEDEEKERIQKEMEAKLAREHDIEQRRQMKNIYDQKLFFSSPSHTPASSISNTGKGGSVSSKGGDGLDEGSKEQKKSQNVSINGAEGQSIEEGEEEDLSKNEEDDLAAQKNAEEMAKLAALEEMKKMKNELEQGISISNSELEKLDMENRSLQKKINMIHEKKGIVTTTSSDVNMNNYKYLNALSNVFHVRQRMRQTQDSYNKMAENLQNKLNFHQEKCNEMKKYFKDFKRAIAENSEFNRSGKKIPLKTIEELEKEEEEAEQKLHGIRLQNIILKKELQKKEKSLKKKEELAEGLHIIDFEQLKIENQTLNEKIEERN